METVTATDVPRACPVKFGTDGWRGVMAEDFTFANLRVAVSAIANYILAEEDPRRGICIAYDTRFGSERFAQSCGRSGGLRRHSGAIGKPYYTHARVVLRGARNRRCRRHHDHFQPQSLSVEWREVQSELRWVGQAIHDGRHRIVSGQATPRAASTAEIARVDFLPDYIEAITSFVDLEKIAASGYKFAIDSMYGAGAGILAGIFSRLNIPYIEIHREHNPLFPGINPEPIEPHLRDLQQTVVEHRCQAGMATDGDADRIGGVDENGNVVDAHKIFAILLRWLIERKQWPGEVVRAFNTTRMLDRICARHGRKLHEVGIGFKYICDLMLEREILVGGEESGGIGIQRHLPERDGLLNALLLANVMADENETLGQLVAGLQKEYGEHYYDRMDLHIDDETKNAAIARARAGVKSFAGMAVDRVETLDGMKFFLRNPEAATKPGAAESWLLLRASGTEPLLRIYAESCSLAAVQSLLEAGREFALQSGRSR